MRYVWTATVGFLLLAAAGGAQDDPHAACTGPAGWVPREILDRPLPRRSGTGNSHEVVTTSSPEAQGFYDQGLDYLHGYVWIEAGRSFRQALRLDPKLAMAWVGLSRVYSGLDDEKAARQAQAKAEALASGASAREQRRIALRGKQLEALADLWNPAKHLEYKKAIDAALAADMKDVELWLLRGNAEEPTAAGRGQRGGAASVAFYSQVLRLSPDNGAAHHYLTHSYETIGGIPEALAHGEVYARTAPAVPHAHHMWGHDLRRVGRIDDAIAAFRKTDELEKAYYAAERIAPEMDWHHIHNLDLLATAYQHKGQARQAEATMREAFGITAAFDRAEFDQKQLPAFLLARGRWDDALEAAQRMSRGKWAGTRAVAHALAGHAHLARGRKAEAKAALASAVRELTDVPAAAAGIAVSRPQVQPWVDMLRGEMMMREGATAEGRALLEGVAKTLRAAPGPDAWIQALFRLEAIASLAREVGAWDLAATMAQQMLDHDAAYAGSHLAAALMAEHKGDSTAAARSLAAAERYWAQADADLPELALVRAKKAKVAGIAP
jgi:tetratricopeptide (TPR) repeat protein